MQTNKQTDFYPNPTGDDAAMSPDKYYWEFRVWQKKHKEMQRSQARHDRGHHRQTEQEQPKS